MVEYAAVNIDHRKCIVRKGTDKMQSILQWVIEFLGLTDAQLNILGLILTVGTIVVGFALNGLRMRRIQRQQEALRRAQVQRKNWKNISLQVHDHGRLPDGRRTLGIRNVLTAEDVNRVFALPGAAELLERVAEAHAGPSPFPDVDLTDYLKDLAGWFGQLLPRNAGPHICALFIEKGPNTERFILRGVACTLEQLEEYDDEQIVFTTEPGRDHQVDRITASRFFATAVIDHPDPTSHVGTYNGRKVTEFVDPSKTGK